MIILFHMIFYSMHDLVQKVVAISTLNQQLKRFFKVTIQ